MMMGDEPSTRIDRLFDELTELLSEGEIRCTQVICQPGGHLWLVFERGAKRAVLVWAAKLVEPNAGVPTMFGMPLQAGQGMPRADLVALQQLATRRLQPLWSKLRLRLDIGNREVNQVSRSAAALTKLVEGRHPEGQSCWYEWEPGAIEPIIDLPFGGFIFPYRAGRKRVDFALVSGDAEPRDFPVVARTPLGAVLRVRDDRTVEERARLDNQVERALWFTMGRCLHAGMEWVESEGSRFRLTDLLSGTHVPVELGEDMFFGLWGEQSMGNVQLLSSHGLGGVVNHSNRECTVGMVHVTGLDDRLYFNPWKLPASRLDDFLITDFDDHAALNGGEERLEEAVAQVAGRAGKLPIFVTQMCEYGYLNDDMENVVERVANDTEASIALMHNPRSKHHPLAAFNNWWSDALRTAMEREHEQDPLGVNLLGLGPASPAISELESLLAEFGVTVHAHLFPRMDGGDLATLNRARLWVATPWVPMLETIGSSLAAVGVASITAAAPYGAHGTLRWLSAILGALGRPAPSAEEYAAVVRRRAPNMPALADHAASTGLGFVVPEGCLAEAASAEFFYGLEPFAFVEDLGYRIVVVTTRAMPGSPEPTAAELAERLRVRDPERIVYVRRRPGEAIGAALRRAPAELFYSDYPSDSRLAAAGKMPFNVRGFEPGIEGAARTIERLTGAARVPFFARYHEFVGQGQT